MYDGLDRIKRRRGLEYQWRNEDCVLLQGLALSLVFKANSRYIKIIFIHMRIKFIFMKMLVHQVWFDKETGQLGTLLQPRPKGFSLKN